MATESITWPTPPDDTDENDGTQAYNLGREFTLTAERLIIGVEWRVPDSVANPAGGPHAIAIWDVAGSTRLAYKEVTPTPGGVEQLLFDGGDEVDGAIGTVYAASVYTNHYAFSSGADVGSTSPSGEIVAGDSVLIPFNSGAATAPLPDNVSGANFYISPITSDGALDAVSPNGIAVPVTLGAPSVNSALTVSPSDLAVATALGQLAVTPAASAPNGLAVATALGQPAVTPAPSAPDGLAVSVSLGEPTVITAYSVSPDGLSVPLTLGAPAIVRTAAPDGLAVSVTLGAPEVGRAPGGGGWHDFAGIIEGARQDARLNAERRRNPVDCPIHNWPLETNSRGVKHCKFGGHVVATGGW